MVMMKELHSDSHSLLNEQEDKYLQNIVVEENGVEYLQFLQLGFHEDHELHITMREEKDDDEENEEKERDLTSSLAACFPARS
jgi:hypothetical protein